VYDFFPRKTQQSCHDLCWSELEFTEYQQEFQEHRGRSLWEKKKNKPELYIPFMTSTKNLVNVGTKYHKYLLFKDTTENKEFFIKVSYILTNNNLLTRN
jgi:hypothetical protein